MTESQPSFTAVLAAAGPLALLVFGLLPAGVLNRHGLRAARLGARVALAALVCALLADAGLACVGKVNFKFSVAGPFQLGVYFDNLSAIGLTLVAFLLAVVSRYSVNYLAGDPAQGRFTKWLSLTGGSVLAIVISGNLVQFALAWSATSLCLQQLLVFYPERPGALLAARKKFLISRLGDACLLAVVALVFEKFHTWDFAGMFAVARQLHETGMTTDRWEINAICILLVVGAMLKSAQFPFHSWLPDTMETPTPVSALMHAGIINAGGFLIIRLNPLVTLSPAALSVLALFGAFTALFASLVMLTHASVKRSLAFSTVAQMGFMMLECGLGAFSLAVLHLVAHSLYKAHAFLSSGSIVRLAKSAWVPAAQPNAHPLTLIASFAVAGVLTLGSAWIFGVDWRHEPGQIVPGCAFAMALAYALWNLWNRSVALPRVGFGAIFGGGIVITYFSLHQAFASLLGSNDWVNSQLDSLLGLLPLATLLALFLVVLVLQTELPQWANRPSFQALYVHARNGFYFNTLANRTVAALWPVSHKPPRH
ncbi:MAG TPA: proton-conducting transporter membrane subunit [Candidatus Acidoferrum sp.]|nr:proton-conducting transporter membrane subunit [Candidatus Acidoferrum sp.]